MTWIRWDCDTPGGDLVYDIAAALSCDPVKALGHYNAMCCGIGKHRPDAKLTDISDGMIELWGMWRGKKGRFAAAIRERCTADDGYLRGWKKRNHKLMQPDHASSSNDRFVYAMQRVQDRAIKVGVSRNPHLRLRDFDTALGKGNVTLLGFRSAAGLYHEKRIHRDLADYQIGGEWFRPDPAVMDYLSQHVTSGNTSGEPPAIPEARYVRTNGTDKEDPPTPLSAEPADRATWLTPWLEIYQAHVGTIDAKRLAKVVSGPRKAESDAAWRSFRNWCTDPEVRKWCPKVGAWSERWREFVPKDLSRDPLLFPKRVGS